MALPRYFYSLEANFPDGRKRWFDEFSDPAPSIIQPKDLDIGFQNRKHARNEAYSRWQAAFFTKGTDGELEPLFRAKNMKWQAIRILSFRHSESTSKDWWEMYQDAVFRVFVSPETVYDKATGEHKQWYLLSPEDSYLVNRHELEQKGPVDPRDYNGRERFLSANKILRRARLVPVECCRHLRHETTAGVLPEGL